MEMHNIITQKTITEKLGFDIKEYNKKCMNNISDAHEADNIPNPFEKLSKEELLYIRNNNYFLDNKIISRLLYEDDGNLDNEKSK